MADHITRFWASHCIANVISQLCTIVVCVLDLIHVTYEWKLHVTNVLTFIF